MRPRIIVLFLLTQGAFMATSAQNFWQPINVYSGSVVAFVVNQEDHVYAGTVGGGVFRSTNNGLSWTAVNTGLANLQVLALVITPMGNLIAGTYGGGAFRSMNGGESWTPVNAGLTHPEVWSLASSSTDVYAGTYGHGVFRSTDDGQSWSRVSTGLTDSVVLALAAHPSGTLFAGTFSAGVFRSSDQGQTWAPANTGLTSGGVKTIGINRVGPPNVVGHIFAGTYGGGIFRSTDEGSSWIQVNNGLTSLVAVFAFAFAPNGQMVVGTFEGAFLSTDNGTSWSQLSSGMGALSVASLARTQSHYLFAGTHGSGAFRSTQPIMDVKVQNPHEPFEVALYQNYPNPFNPGTTIRFSLGVSTRTSLTVYDVLGREIAALLDAVLPPGRHEIVWNAVGVPSGVYFYRLTASEITLSKRLVVMK